MKKILSLLGLLALSLSFSSCCALFSNGTAGYRTSTREVKTCGYDIVTEEVYTPNASGKGGMVTTVEKKVPRYKTVTSKKRVPCRSCVRLYCPKKDCCGTTSEAYMKMATAQGPVGSPNIGLIPTMRKLAE
ncbi:MAG: hypothetical protein OSA84_04090 [Akkermansiaceae bacterium]|nr:hypothetical protein [Akkermansiaceae bacterium]